MERLVESVFELVQKDTMPFVENENWPALMMATESGVVNDSSRTLAEIDSNYFEIDWNGSIDEILAMQSS